MRTSHKVTVTAEVPVSNQLRKAAAVRRAVRAALDAEGVAVPCALGVLFTDDAGIREINRETREIDEVTDVLSFPLLNLRPGKPPMDDRFAEPDSGRTYLGDMVLSLERVKAQAAEYGHSLERELCYLTVHSVLHLLGYDHLDEGREKRRMRRREEQIMMLLSLSR